MPSGVSDDGQRRLAQLCEQWGIVPAAAPAPLPRASRPPTFRTPADDQLADELLQRRAAEAAQARPKGVLRLPFSSGLRRGKGWEPGEVLDALTTWVANAGSPGVAEALAARLAEAGVDLSETQSQKGGSSGAGGGGAGSGGILNKRRNNLDPPDVRVRLLRLAVVSKRVELAQILLPAADSVVIDACLPAAIRGGDAAMAELLLIHGASAAQTVEGQEAFRQACTIHGHAHLVGLVLRSHRRPEPSWTSAAMCDAARAGCLDAVLLLSRSTADGNHNQAEALKSAVCSGRTDIALAIVIGKCPPQRAALNEALHTLQRDSSLEPTTKLQLAEILLLAGAGGVVVSQALESYYQADFVEMATLLAAHGAAADYEGGTVLKSAIARGQLDLVKTLLRKSSAISSSLASSCVSLIANDTASELRVALLTCLLRQGAGGAPLDEMLVHAAKAGDVKSVDLLLTPFFPAVSPRTPSGQQRTPSCNNRHAVAAVDYNSGEALRTALLRADLQMTRKILSRQPSQETLSAVFPLATSLPKEDRCQMVELFLQSSLPSPCLNAALVDAVNSDAAERDISLIKLLLKYDADANFSHGGGLSSLIKEMNLELLAPLVEKVSPKTAAAHLEDVMQIQDRQIRIDVATMLLGAGAAEGAEEVAKTSLAVLSEDPVDLPLLGLLIDQGRADVNILDGAIVKKAVVDPNPEVLELVYKGKPSTSSTTRALRELMPLSSTEDKARKLEILLTKSTRKQDVNSMLVHEVKSLSQADVAETSLSSLKYLLASGADPNAHNAAALCHAVIAAKAQVVQVMLGCSLPPTPRALGVALPHALRISEPTQRLALTKALIQAGVLPVEAGRALTFAISNYADESDLISLLAAGADTSDGEALALSALKESPEILDLVLEKSQPSAEVRSSALGTAMTVKNRDARGKMCRSLLVAGVSAEAASNALLSASRDADIVLCDTLVAHGAATGRHGGRAVVEACRRGSAEVLKVLLKARPDIITSQEILEAGFQAATEVRDLNKRAVIFEQLLKMGVGGDLVHAQLQSAARYGEDGIPVLKVLLAAGADPNHNNGDCVVSAASCAFFESLDLLLGLGNEGADQKKVTQPTLLRALGACWGLQSESRHHITCSLLKAGLQANDDLHKALNDAVNEKDPEERLVKLLLDNGASPSFNECKALKDVARNAAAEILALLLETNLPAEHVEGAFSEAFSAENFNNWFTDDGLETARLLLDRAANAEALSRALVLVMKNSFADIRALTDAFFDLLVAHGPDVDYNGGELLQQAASKADLPWTARLLECNPSADTLSLAFQRIFDSETTQEGVLDLFQMFTERHEGEVEIEAMLERQGSEPVLKRAIRQYPRSTMVLRTLLDVGFYHDQATSCRIYSEIDEDERTTILLWAIAQPQKRVSTAVIELLIDRGARVNAESSLSRTTPLMLATQSRRPDLVKMLVERGADVDAIDSLGRTSLSMATNIGGDVAVQLMTTLLAAEPSRDDGSLHNAARELNLPAVQLLLQAGHDPDFPSPLHGGRSALGEVCLHGSDAGEMAAFRERAMLKVMMLLMGTNSDLTIQSNGKSFLLLCFESADPVVTTRALLKSGMWRHVNEPFNRFNRGGYTYSPTMYIARVLGPSSVNDQLLSVLHASRATDTFYATEGPQPEGAVGLPEAVEARERARKARLSRIAKESEDFSIAMARKQQMADVEQQILAQQDDAEDSRRRKMHVDMVASMRSRAEAASEVEAATHRRRLEEQRALAAVSISSTRALAETELEAEEARRRKALAWEQQLNTARVGHSRAMSRISLCERQEVERIESVAEKRLEKRLTAQRMLVESQDKLADRLAAGGAQAAGRARPLLEDGQRQMGYVTELG